MVDGEILEKKFPHIDLALTHLPFCDTSESLGKIFNILIKVDQETNHRTSVNIRMKWSYELSR